MHRNVIVDLIISFLVLLLIYTAASKLFDFNEYADQMRNQPFPSWMSSILIWAVPFSEIAIVILLLFDRLKALGLFLSFLMLMTFTIYVGLILMQSFRYVPCSCAGIFKFMTWRTHLIVNIILTAIAFVGFWFHRRHISDIQNKEPLSR